MDKQKCSFCGLEKDKLIEGLEAYICEDCIDNAMDTKQLEELSEDNAPKILKPHEIKAELDKFVIGQERAKKKLSVEIYNHYKRINSKPNRNVEFPKSNILLMGPSGSGKTYLLERLSAILNVPLVIGDATGLTEAGYVGKDVDSLLLNLIDKANGDIELAEKGIIYIDEIDKIISGKESGSKSKDVGGEGVQQSLLKILEGTEYTFDKTGETINTKNILFVCGGAFDGINKVIEQRLTKKKSIGFATSETSDEGTTKSENILHKVQTEDLVEYGLIKEFIGRLHLIATLDELTEEDLKNILTKPKNAVVKQYQALLKLDNIQLKFSKDAIEYVAKEAKRRGTGARGLKGVISDRLNDLMYELPMEADIKEYTVTKEYLTQK